MLRILFNLIAAIVFFAACPESPPEQDQNISPISYGVKAIHVDGTNVWTMGDAGVGRSKDLGATFAKVPIPFSTKNIDSSRAQILTGPGGQDRIWFVLGGQAWFSSDGAKTLAQIQMPNNRKINRIRYINVNDDEEIAIAATDQGLYFSENDKDFGLFQAPDVNDAELQPAKAAFLGDLTDIWEQNRHIFARNDKGIFKFSIDDHAFTKQTNGYMGACTTTISAYGHLWLGKAGASQGLYRMGPATAQKFVLTHQTSDAPDAKLLTDNFESKHVLLTIGNGRCLVYSSDGTDFKENCGTGGLPAKKIHDFAIMGEKTVFVGNDDGLFRSDNFGETFERIKPEV